MILESGSLWALAVADADLAADQGVRLMTFAGAPAGGQPWGCYVEPGWDAWQVCGHQFPFTVRDQQGAGRDRARAQVVIRTGAPAPVVLGLMRHELEHVWQHERSVWISRMNTALTRAVEHLAEDLPGAFRPIYPWLPAERDASASATRLVAGAYATRSRIAVGSVHHSLLNTPMPRGFRESLAVRLMGVAALFPDLLGEALCEVNALNADPGLVAGMVVEELVPDIGRDLYAALILDPVVGAVRDRLPMTIANAWMAAELVGPRAWMAVAEAFRCVERRAMELAEQPAERSALLARLQAA